MLQILHSETHDRCRLIAGSLVSRKYPRQVGLCLDPPPQASSSPVELDGFRMLGGPQHRQAPATRFWCTAFSDASSTAVFPKLYGTSCNYDCSEVFVSLFPSAFTSRPDGSCLFPPAFTSRPNGSCFFLPPSPQTGFGGVGTAWRACSTPTAAIIPASRCGAARYPRRGRWIKRASWCTMLISFIKCSNFSVDFHENHIALGAGKKCIFQ